MMSMRDLGGDRSDLGTVDINGSVVSQNWLDGRMSKPLLGGVVGGHRITAWYSL